MSGSSNQYAFPMPTLDVAMNRAGQLRRYGEAADGEQKKLVVLADEIERLRAALEHRQRPAEQTDACLKFQLDLSLATTFDAVDYANWVRGNAPQLCVGFDRYIRDSEGDIHPSEQVIEMSVYGRMQYTRSKGKGV